MFLTLLFLTGTAAEWVEISQQHYRKPIRTHSSHNPFTTPEGLSIEETTKPWINNRSVSEYNWNKNPLRQSNVGRVGPANVLKTTEVDRNEEDKRLDIDSDEFDIKFNGATKPTVEFNDGKQKGTVERVPNLANIKRVQLNNSPVKSPTINFKDDKTRDKIPKNPFVEDKHEPEKYNNRRIYINKVNQYSTEPTTTFPEDDDEFEFVEKMHVLKKHPKQESKNSTIVKPPKPAFVTETEDFTKYESQEDRFYKVTQRIETKKKHRFTTETIDTTDEIVTEKNLEIPKQTIKQTYMKKDNIITDRPFNRPVEPPLKQDRDRNNDRNQGKYENVNDANINYIPKREQETHKDRNMNQDKENQSQDAPDNKVKNMDNLMKLMKVVADTISQNSRRSFGGKMRYLHDLKNSILANIADRIDATWPDDTPHRRSRSAQASSRGHVHFPSSESALMTISFLTFAVFLIKLVLQVIHTYKNKTMMVAPVMVASAGRVAARSQRTRH